MPSLCLVTLPVLLSSAIALGTPDAKDSDRDGLSDAQEIHKYGTDPKKMDSDGDGVPDGDWKERREFAYTVRSVVQVMRPVTTSYLNDDYQDIRVLDETETYVEMEVIHYPLSEMHRASGGSLTSKERKRWLAAGPSSDASQELGDAIRAAMKEDGIETADFATKEGVVEAVGWLLEHAEYHSGFTSFVTAFDEYGKPYVPEELREGAERNAQQRGWTIEEQWQRELLASGMFATKRRGSCTSSAIYTTGCLRALGVPTRTVLCIPIIDASDEAEWRMLDVGVTHHGVRQVVHSAMDKGRNAWTSHTFNEVFVDGRWRRLNYTKLDQGTLDEQYLGLMTHIGTFHDWADARFWDTVGRRQKTDHGPDVFGFRNPYSTVSLRDEFGPYCDVVNPEEPPIRADIVALHWSDGAALPGDIRESNVERGRVGLVVEMVISSSDKMRKLLERESPWVDLKPEDGDTLTTKVRGNCWWYKNDRGYIYLPLDQDEWAQVERGGTYHASTRNGDAEASIVMDMEIERD